MGEVDTIYDDKGNCYVLHSDYATLEAERDALRAEVAKLRAACAAMDDALRDVIVLADSAMADANRDVGEYDRVGELREARAALATDAGKGKWIDATGATLVVPTQYGIDFTLNLEHDGQCFRLADGVKWNPGNGWIDATGAVEATVKRRRVGGMDDHAKVETFVPTDWAGSRVLIVRVAK